VWRQAVEPQIADPQAVAIAFQQSLTRVTVSWRCWIRLATMTPSVRRSPRPRHSAGRPSLPAAPDHLLAEHGHFAGLDGFDRPMTSLTRRCGWWKAPLPGDRHHARDMSDRSAWPSRFAVDPHGTSPRSRSARLDVDAAEALDDADDAGAPIP